MSETKTEGLIYKGHPLRRIDNLIYYGTMADPYIVMMQILESKKENGLDMATKVSLQLQSTNPNRFHLVGAGVSRQVRTPYPRTD